MKRLIKDAKQKVFLIVDNLRVHHAKAVQDWLARHKVEIEIFYLPAYAPEHNPDEYLNNDLKQTIKNKPRAKTRDDLVAATSSILKSIQKRPDRVKSYFHAKHVRSYFPLSHGVPRVDDRRVISGIVFVIRNGLRWRDAPRDYGPHKTIYNRFVRWSRLGVFNKIFAELARKAGKSDRLMIDATHLKAHRTAASLLKKGLFPDVSGAPKAA